LRKFKASLFVSGFVAGLLADWVTYIATSFELASALHGSKPIFPLFVTILIAFVPTQLPLGILEGFLTGGMIVFVAKRRPDILISLGVIKETGKRIVKGEAKIIGIFLIALLLFANSHFAFAEKEAKWSGVDENVVEKVAKEHGRTAWTPFINTDQGDLLLFVFLLAGAAGGFVMGYNFRKLFVEKKD
ncbi:MAG: energy-coupling factor ABC transporter permease, partial [Candidatus Omnitrophota bacterium]